MTVTATPTDAPAPPAGPACERCGSPLGHGQEWCHHCGGARTLIHTPPDWRVPAAVIGTVVMLVLAAFAIALINLSSNADRSAVTTTVTAAAPPPATTARAGAPAPRPINGWPAGQTGWTVQLASSPTAAAARAQARELIRSGLRAGVLDSSRHAAMTPGAWIVFAGHFPSQAAAETRAGALATAGHPSATAVLVAAPTG